MEIRKCSSLDVLPADEAQRESNEKAMNGEPPSQLRRTKTSYSFNELTHVFTVVEPEQPLWQQIIHEHYPGSVREEAFVKKSHTILSEYGFTHYNTLSCVSLCRDEMCSPFLNMVDEHWKAPFMNIKDEFGKKETLYTHSFIMSSLAGMLFLGTSGMKAALSHAPLEKGRRRYVFFAFPHIGIGDKGVFGEVERPGHEVPSEACGALSSFVKELESGNYHLELEPTDIEYSLLKQRLLKKVQLFSGKAPSIKQITDITHRTIVEDLKRLVDATIDKECCDYAILTGIQIHTPGGASYIWPSTMYIIKDGQRIDLKPDMLK